VSPVKYKLGFYIPEDDILHSHRRENLKSYILNLSYFLHLFPNINAVLTLTYKCMSYVMNVVLTNKRRIRSQLEISSAMICLDVRSCLRRVACRGLSTDLFVAYQHDFTVYF
jgi:hypothetical protein